MAKDAFDRGIERAQQAGLSWEAQDLYATLAYWSWWYGLPEPEIISGLRSSRRQAELRRCYDRDPRTARSRCGTIARPARQSTHTTGDGFDLADDGWLDTRGAWTQYLGYTWGGAFRSPDPNHFDVRRT